jgi:hypothetical protein
MEIQWRKALLLSSSLATLGVVASPSFASPSNAQIYGQIQLDGTLDSGSSGITSVTNPSLGHYCILPSSSTLRTDVNNGSVGVQLTTRYWNWGSPPFAVAYQIQGTNLRKVCTVSGTIGVVVGELSGGVFSPTGPSGTTGIPGVGGYVDFTIMFE